MKKNNFSGLFIVFEGLDGSGLSTQAKLISAKLQSKGYPNLVTKEPTNNLIGGLIRGQLTHDWQASMECLQLLFAADRAHHLDREIIPALKAGKIVISDRYFFSSVAFGSLKLKRDWLLKLNENFLYPDLTFLIKVPVNNCIKRMRESRFKFELFEEKEKLAEIWKGYEWLAKEFKDVYLVDGTSSTNQVANDISRTLNKFLKKKLIFA